MQLISSSTEQSDEAAGCVYLLNENEAPIELTRLTDDQLIGFAVSHSNQLESTIEHSLECKHDILLLDGSGKLGTKWPELATTPDFSILRDAVRILRKMKEEEMIDLIYFGGVRSGTDAAKLIGLGANAVIMNVCVGLAIGGEIQGKEMEFSSNYSDEDRVQGLVNIVKANLGEASMMARCTGKTNLYNIEPEDLCAITLSTSNVTGIPLAGKCTHSVN